MWTSRYDPARPLRIAAVVHVRRGREARRRARSRSLLISVPFDLIVTTTPTPRERKRPQTPSTALDAPHVAHASRCASLPSGTARAT